MYMPVEFSIMQLSESEKGGHLIKGVSSLDFSNVLVYCCIHMHIIISPPPHPLVYLSLLSFSLVLHFSPSPTPQVHPLFILSVSDFILAILWMIGGIVWLTPGEHGWASEGSDPHTGMCYVLAVATTVSK